MEPAADQSPNPISQAIFLALPITPILPCNLFPTRPPPLHSTDAVASPYLCSSAARLMTKLPKNVCAPNAIASTPGMTRRSVIA